MLVVVAPASATDVGLQLSAAATAGLIAWSTPISHALERRLPHVPGWVREGLGVSLAAQAATLPIVLLSFGRLAPLSPVLNLAVVPLVPLAMGTGALALAGGAVTALGGPALVAALAGLPAAITLGLLVWIVRAGADRAARQHRARSAGRGGSLGDPRRRASWRSVSGAG